MSIRHQGHRRVVGSGVSRWLKCEIMRFIGLTTKKNTAAAMVTNAIRALRKSPYRNSDPWIRKLSALKSGRPKMAATSGVRLDLAGLRPSTAGYPASHWR